MSLGEREVGALREVGIDADHVPRILSGQIIDAVDRALKAGATPPLEYVGAGATGIVLGDSRKKAYKVARTLTPHHLAGLQAEHEWLVDANETSGVKGLVVKHFRYFPEPYAVLVNALAEPIGGKVYGIDLWDLHQGIAKEMLKKDWGMPEYKDDSWVWTARGPVLVDCSVHVRRGKRFLRYVRDILSGERPWYDEQSWMLLNELSAEVSAGTITEKEAAPVRAQLEALKG